MKNISILVFLVALGLSSIIVYAEPERGGKMKKTGDSSDETIDASNMQKDFDELMKLYKELRIKAQEFQKKYRGMLPPELMPLVMRQHGNMMGGQDGNQQPVFGGQQEKEGRQSSPNKKTQDQDIFE